MINKEYLTKVYRHFKDFTAEASARELEYFVLDSKHTDAFNTRMKEIVESIRKDGKEDIEFSILFNTEGQVAVIDSDIIGRFIGNNYNVSIQRYYKTDNLNKVVRLVVNGTEKNKTDFVIVSYKIIHDTLKTIYNEIIYRKDIEEGYIKKYGLENYSENDIAIVIPTLMIMEDIVRYLNISQTYLKDCVTKL